MRDGNYEDTPLVLKLQSTVLKDAYYEKPMDNIHNLYHYIKGMTDNDQGGVNAWHFSKLKISKGNDVIDCFEDVLLPNKFRYMQATHMMKLERIAEVNTWLQNV